LRLLAKKYIVMPREDDGGRWAQVFFRTPSNWRKLRLGKFYHRMLANCYKVGTMRTVKGCRQNMTSAYQI